MTAIEPDRVEPDRLRAELTSIRVRGKIRDVVVALAAEGLSVVVTPEAADATLEGVFINTPRETILQAIAEAAGPHARVLQRRGFVYIGPLTSTDKSVQVFFVGQGDAADWAEAYTLAGGAVEVTPLFDMLVVTGEPSAVQRVAALHEVATGGRRQYVVDLCLVELGREEADTLGIEFTLSGLASIAVDQLGAGMPESGLEAMLSGTLLGEASAGNESSITASRLWVVEGSRASQAVGDTIRIRTRSVSDQGTVTDTGVETVQTGTTVGIDCLGLPSGRVRLDLIAALEVLRDFNGDLPTTATRRFESQVILGMGGVAVLGGFETSGQGVEESRFPGTNRATSTTGTVSERRLFLFIQVTEAFNGEPERGNGQAPAQANPAAEPVQERLRQGDQGQGRGRGPRDPRSWIQRWIRQG